jgi:perosamine synthetase
MASLRTPPIRRTTHTAVRVPLALPDITDAERDAVLRVLQSPVLSQGPRAEAFERAVARTFRTHAVAVCNGTAGLHLAVIAAGIGDHDLAITTPFSFVASANCLLFERAVPVFVDIDPVTLNIDASRVAAAAEALVTGGKSAEPYLPPTLRGRRQAGRLKALLPVHVFGQPADVDPMLGVAGRLGLTVIEDSCEAIGAEYKGRKAGTLGDVGVFAFYPNKQMTTGEGGMLVTPHDDWDALFRSLRNQGRDAFDTWTEHSRLGFNYRLNEMSAALGEVQVGRLDELLAKRARVAAMYGERLADVPHVSIPCIATTTTRMSWFAYVVRVAACVDRTEVMKRLAGAGIPTHPYFPPIHLQPFYRERFGYEHGSFPETEAAGASCVALPFSGLMTADQVDLVVEELRRALHTVA